MAAFAGICGASKTLGIILTVLFFVSAAAASAVSSPEGVMGQHASTYDNVLTDSLYAVQEVRQRIAAKEANYLSQYLLNPFISIKDVVFVLERLALLLILRFALAGAYHEATRKCPTIFKLTLSQIARPRKIEKMSENLWYTLWHTFSFCMGIRALYYDGGTADEPGWTRLLIRSGDIKWFWLPSHAEVANGGRGWPLFNLSAVMQRYYLLEIAFWLSCSVFLLLEVQRDDFHAMALHHIVTCTLVVVSYTASFWRLGAVILLTHDFADILLYSAKAVHYTWTPPIVTDVMFVCFVVGFFLSRLVFFPLFCVRPVLYVSNLIEWSGGRVKSHADIPGGVALPLFLCVLQVLHIFWFGLIIRMIMRSFRGRHVSDDGDIRSDDGGRDDIAELAELEKIEQTAASPKVVQQRINNIASRESANVAANSNMQPNKKGRGTKRSKHN